MISGAAQAERRLEYHLSPRMTFSSFIQTRYYMKLFSLVKPLSAVLGTRWMKLCIDGSSQHGNARRASVASNCVTLRIVSLPSMLQPFISMSSKEPFCGRSWISAACSMTRSWSGRLISSLWTRRKRILKCTFGIRTIPGTVATWEKKETVHFRKTECCMYE